MNIDKALAHFGRNKNNWKPNLKDMKPITQLLITKNSRNKKALSENESLGKTLDPPIDTFKRNRNVFAERAIQVIDEILSKSVYDWTKKMHEQANIMRFKTLLDDKQYKDALKKFRVRENT